MSFRKKMGRTARLLRDVPLIGGTLPAGVIVQIDSEPRAGRLNIQAVGGPQRVCELPMDAVQLLPPVASSAAMRSVPRLTRSVA